MAQKAEAPSSKTLGGYADRPNQSGSSRGRNIPASKLAAAWGRRKSLGQSAADCRSKATMKFRESMTVRRLRQGSVSDDCAWCVLPGQFIARGAGQSREVFPKCLFLLRARGLIPRQARQLRPVRIGIAIEPRLQLGQGSPHPCLEDALISGSRTCNLWSHSLLNPPLNPSSRPPAA